MLNAQLANLLGICSLFALLIASVIVAYYWLLAIISLTGRRSGNHCQVSTLCSFAIVIPAHNEECGIGRTIQSCHHLDYPKDAYGIYVIADNCSDRTANIATANHVMCFERRNSDQLGKGYALEFAFRHVDLEKHHAIVVLDADCEINPCALRVFNRQILAGHKVLQANCIASNPDESATSYLLAVGNCIENELFYAAKSRLRLAVLLRGTGMVLHRDILRQTPWHAHSIVEDVEYAVALARAGVPVDFVREVEVSSAMPSDWAQMRTQRARWASGTLGFAKRQAARLVWEGWCKRQWRMLDLGWTLLTASRPLVGLLLLLPLVLASARILLMPAGLSVVVLTPFVIPLALFLGYVFLGIASLGVTWRRLGFLLCAPLIALRLVVIAIAGVLGVNRRVWARTPR